MKNKENTQKRTFNQTDMISLLSPIIDVGDNLMYTFVFDVKSEWRIFNGFWSGKIRKWNSNSFKKKSKSLKNGICSKQNRLFFKNNRLTPNKFGLLQKKSIYSTKKIIDSLQIKQVIIAPSPSPHKSIIIYVISNEYWFGL